jgi:ABC-type multidrug transport system fused ATPase/permease subunit
VALASSTQIPLLSQVTSSAGSTTSFAFGLPDANSHPMFYVGVYAAIGLSAVVITLLSSIVQYLGALRASRILFKQLLENVVFATMRWHDTTPQGAHSY